MSTLKVLSVKRINEKIYECVCKKTNIFGPNPEFIVKVYSRGKSWIDEQKNVIPDLYYLESTFSFIHSGDRVGNKYHPINKAVGSFIYLENYNRTASQIASEKIYEETISKLTGTSKELFDALVYILDDRIIALGYLGTFEDIVKRATEK